MKLFEKLVFVQNFLKDQESFANDDVPEDWIHSDGRIYDPELKYRPPVVTKDGDYIDTNYDKEDYLEDNDDLDDYNYSSTSVDRYNVKYKIQDDEEDETVEKKVEEKVEEKTGKKEESECKITDIFNFKCHSKLKIMFISIIAILIILLLCLIGFAVYYFFFRSNQQDMSQVEDISQTSVRDINDSYLKQDIPEVKNDPGYFDGLFTGLFAPKNEIDRRSVVKNISNISISNDKQLSTSKNEIKDIKQQGLILNDNKDYDSLSSVTESKEKDDKLQENYSINESEEKDDKLQESYSINESKEKDDKLQESYSINESKEKDSIKDSKEKDDKLQENYSINESKEKDSIKDSKEKDDKLQESYSITDSNEKDDKLQESYSTNESKEKDSITDSNEKDDKLQESYSITDSNESNITDSNESNEKDDKLNNELKKVIDAQQSPIEKETKMNQDEILRYLKKRNKTKLQQSQ